MYIEEQISKLHDIVADLGAHTKALLDFHRSTAGAVLASAPVTSPPAETSVASVPPSEAATASPVATVTLDQVKVAGKDLCAKFSRDALTKVLENFNVVKLSDVKADDYPKLLETINKALAVQS